jgi:GNAT superfamily N-acetyltransferase
MDVRRVCSVADPAYDAFVRIYLDSQPHSELKTPAQLARMIEKPEYYFLAALRNATVVAYSIAICLVDCDAALLEYMAVDRNLRGTGIGQSLFRATRNFGAIAGRILLIEVDSEKWPSDDHIDRVRRKNFYRRLGCKEIEGLTYIMPPLSSATPPLMDLLVSHGQLPLAFSKSRVRTWLESCYQQVYQVAPNDPRIDSMIEALPDDLRLI